MFKGVIRSTLDIYNIMSDVYFLTNADTKESQKVKRKFFMCL